MPDTSLLLLLDEVRAKTLRILDAAPAESVHWAPPGLQNTSSGTRGTPTSWWSG